MKKRLKRMLVYVLALTMMISILPGNVKANDIIAEDNNVIITRAQWIHELAQLFEMEVDEENSPDNYFSDIDENSAYYDDLMALVSAGVIDIEAGQPFYPEEAVTREFAVHTLNFGLGYQLEEGETYTFSDSSSCTYPDDAQIALNRGWVSIIGGKFSPDTVLTDTEVQTMIQDAQGTIQSESVDEDYESTWKISNEIIEVPWYTDITVDDGKVTIIDSPVTISNGDRFVIYQGDIAVPYKASEVSVLGNITTIETETLDYEDAFDSVDAQGVVDSSELTFEAAEGVDLDVISEYVQEDNSRATKKIKNATFKKDIKLSNNVTSSVNGTFKNIVVEYQISTATGTAFVQVSGDLSLTCSVKVTPSVLGSATLDLFTVGVPGIGGLTVSAEVKAAGKLSSTINSHVTIGLSYSKSGGMRTIRSFKENGGSNSTAEAEASIGVNLKCGITQMKVLSGYVYAKAGVMANFSDSVYTDGKTPVNCRTFIAYMYASYGATASCSFSSKKFDYTVNIFDLNNSPFRVYHHYEDGREVAACARGENINYFTKWNSAYWGSGWYGAYGAYGYDMNGNPVQIYKYTLDSSNNATITGYYGNERNLVIPETIDGYTVVAIGTGAFKGNVTIKNVEIPDTVTVIGCGAFLNCTNLISVYLPKDVASGEYCKQSPAYPGPFEGCSALSIINFADGFTEIKTGLLYGSGITSITIPETVTDIDYAAFGRCSKLSKINWNNKLKNIGSSAFANCAELKEINLPDSLVTLGCGAFQNCTNITSVYLPKDIKTGEHCAANSAYPGPFYGCSSLTDVVFADGYTEIKDGLFYGSGITSITIPDTVTKIDYCAFSRCENLQDIQWGSSLTTIDTEAFYGCISLKEIQFPDSLNLLGCAAFKNCTNLQSIYLPKNIETGAYCAANSAYPGPFYGCTSLTDVTFAKGYTEIKDGLFYGSGITSITIPDTVTKIDYCAFLRCENLKEVNLQNGITTIGDYAFDYTALTEVILPDTITNMGEYIFANCTNLSSVKLPATIQNISSKMFYECRSLTSLELPDTVISIMNYAFENSGIESITLPSNVTTIGVAAFKNSSLKTITFSGKETTIGNYAFQNCDNLTSVSIPDSATRLGKYIFQDCDALTDVILGNGITSIPAYAFEHCDALKKVIIPYRVTSIADHAFANCIVFSDITIPRATTKIDTTAFSYPAKMTITGISETYAETFANEQGIAFVNNEINATKVILNESNLQINKDATAMLIMTVTPDDFTDEVDWKSSDTDIVTISDSGLITAKGVGTATIKVTVGNVSASCNVTVVQPVTSIVLNETSLSMEALDTFKLIASVYPDDANNKLVIWNSSNPEVATVDNQGNVTALSKGNTTISVTTMDGSGISKLCYVTVTNNANIVNDISGMQSTHPYENNCNDVWSYTLPGACNLKLTFSPDTEMEDGFDYLYILDAENNQIGKYTGTELAGKSIVINGNTVKIKLDTDNGGNAYGFAVNEIIAVDDGATTGPSIIDKPTSVESTTKPIETVTDKSQVKTTQTSPISPTQETTVKPTTRNAVTTTKVAVVKPAKVKITKASNVRGKKVKLTWKKINDISGYQIMYATNKKFTKNKKTTNAKATAVSKTIKKLKKKKTYYFRIRAYRKNDLAIKKYGSWSQVKKVKVKK